MRSAPLAFALLAPLALAHAQEVHVTRRVDEILGGQPIKRFLRSGIDDSGSLHGVWLRTAAAHALNGVLVRDDAILLAEGTTLANPLARVRLLGETEGSGDNLVQNLVLDSFVPPRAYPAAEALLHRGVVLLQSHEPVLVSGLPSTTICSGIGSAAANGRGTVLAYVELDGNPADVAILRFDFDDSGAPLARTLALRAGQALPDGSVFTGAGARIAVDEDGNGLTRIEALDGIDRLVRITPTGTQVILRANTPSPVPGHTLREIQRHYDQNGLGGLATGVVLDGALDENVVLLKNGQPLFREGELVPSLSPGVPPRRLANLGLVRLSNSGNVYWQALINTEAPSRGSFMRDRQPILQAGVSLVDGELVTGFAYASDNFDISPSGRFWIGRVTLERTGDALVTADFGASRVLPGCTPNASTLRHTDGLVLAGHTIRLVLDGPAAPGALATLHFASAAARPGSACGITTPFGELLLDPTRVVGMLVAGIAAGGPVVLDLPIPANVALVDRQFFAQGVFVGAGLELTNGLMLEIGAP
jgi:hypothetical protein